MKYELVKTDTMGLFDLLRELKRSAGMNHIDTMKLAQAVIDAARAAMDESFEAGNEQMDISIPAHLAAALSLRLDEYDRAALAEQPAHGCDHCSHAMYAGTKCKHCGRVTEQPTQQALDKMAENARELGIQMQPAQEQK